MAGFCWEVDRRVTPTARLLIRWWNDSWWMWPIKNDITIQHEASSVRTGTDTDKYLFYPSGDTQCTDQPAPCDICILRLETGLTE